MANAGRQRSHRNASVEEYICMSLNDPLVLVPGSWLLVALFLIRWPCICTTWYCLFKICNKWILSIEVHSANGCCCRMQLIQTFLPWSWSQMKNCSHGMKFGIQFRKHASSTSLQSVFWTLEATTSTVKAFYLHFLMEKLPQLLEDIPLATQQTVVMHDAACAYFTHSVKPTHFDG